MCLKIKKAAFAYTSILNSLQYKTVKKKCLTCKMVTLDSWASRRPTISLKQAQEAVHLLLKIVNLKLNRTKIKFSNSEECLKIYKM